MLKKYIINGCECWLTKRTGDRILADFQEIAEERKAWENVQRAYEIAVASNDPIDWSIYSDLHKDYYGVRPH